MKNNKITTKLTELAFIDYDHFKNLQSLAQNENWNYKDNPNEEFQNPILFNYIVFTFDRLANLYNQDNNSNFLVFEQNKILMNTGLMTKNYERIYMLLKEHKQIIKQKYYCVGFFKESSIEVQKFKIKPRKAEYITKLSDLLYDTRLPLSINIDHILNDEENKKRLPKHLQDSPTLLIAFNGAIDILKKKLEINYKIAVPQCYNNRIQFLLPICLQNNETPDIVLAVEKHGDYYTGHTCLTVDMAYNNARLISKPETNWLTNIVK